MGKWANQLCHIYAMIQYYTTISTIFLKNKGKMQLCTQCYTHVHPHHILTHTYAPTSQTIKFANFPPCKCTMGICVRAHTQTNAHTHSRKEYL